MIGGVITSTLLTLLVIPTVYKILDVIRVRFFRFFKRKSQFEVPHPPETQS